jgi:hypothetical protein
MDERMLEMRLVDLGAHIEYPAVPALTSLVRERISAVPSRPLSWWRRPAALAAAACFLLAALAVVAVPTSRQAVADFLGIDGIRISFDPAPREAVGTELALGRRVTFSEAQNSVDFDLLVPQRLGDPDVVYLNPYARDGEVSFVYEPRADLPEAAETGVGALLTQFVGDNDIPSLKKKFVGGATDVIPVHVDGVPGFWVDGAHNLYPAGGAPRVAGQTLLWQVGAIGYRLEVDAPLEEALAIAESLE